MRTDNDCDQERGQSSSVVRYVIARLMQGLEAFGRIVVINQGNGPPFCCIEAVTAGIDIITLQRLVTILTLLLQASETGLAGMQAVQTLLQREGRGYLKEVAVRQTDPRKSQNFPWKIKEIPWFSTLHMVLVVGMPLKRICSHLLSGSKFLTRKLSFQV